MKERNKPTKSFIARSIEEIEKEAFKKGYEAGRHAMIEWLRELQRGYENDLDAEPRIYESDKEGKIYRDYEIEIVEYQGG